VTTRTKIVIAVLVVLIGAAVVGANIYYQRDRGVQVATEAIRSRDLEAIVSASGKIQPKRQVNISANTMGKVTRLAVEEGQRVKAGQFLLEIDPRSLAGQLERGEASIAAAQSSLQAGHTAVESANINLDLARTNLKRQQELWKDGLTTKESLERAQNDVAGREADLRSREQEIKTRQEQIKQEQAGLATTKYNLSQVIISSPMDGLVTRRNIEEGETAAYEAGVHGLHPEVVKMMGKMLIGHASLKNLSGPLTIADYAGQSVKLGFAYYLGFLAVVSVSLGVLNLLPLPILDGGYLMYYLFEAVTGRPVSEQWLARLQQGGLAFVLLMMSLALYNDVARLLGLH